MNYWRLYRAVGLAALLLVVGQVLLVPLSVSARSEAPPTVPDEIAVPSDAVLLFSSHARGVQIYDCIDGFWKLYAPRALLFDPQSRRPTIIHYGGIDRGLTAGPWWESIKDGSRVRGRSTGSALSPNPDSIPLLRLAVQEHQGDGMFSSVTYIQRLNTTGGVSPTGSCERHARRQVPYTADYYFYGNSQL